MWSLSLPTPKQPIKKKLWLLEKLWLWSKSCGLTESCGLKVVVAGQKWWCLVELDRQMYIFYSAIYKCLYKKMWYIPQPPLFIKPNKVCTNYLFSQSNATIYHNFLLGWVVKYK